MVTTPLDENRGKGYASHVLRSIEKDARQAGCSNIELKSMPLAIKLYERHGFTVVGPKSKYNDLTPMRKELLKESHVSL